MRGCTGGRLGSIGLTAVIGFESTNLDSGG